MKLIVLHSIYNNCDLKTEIPESKLPHPKDIPKGTIINFPGPDTMSLMDALGKNSALRQSDKRLLAELVFSESVGDAKDEKLVKKILEEVEIDRKREAKRNQEGEASRDRMIVSKIAEAVQALA